jgi:hypothetical protein
VSAAARPCCNVRLRDGLVGTEQAVGDLPDGHRTADEGDSPATLLDEVRHGEIAARDVVHRHRGKGATIGDTVDEDGDDPVRTQPLQSVEDAADRGDQQAADPLLLEQIEVGGLPLGQVVAVGEQDAQSVLRGLLLGSASDVGEERVAYVEQDEADRRALARLELAGSVIADEAELLDGGDHPGAGRLGHFLGPVEHVGHRPEGNASPLRDVLDAHLSPRHGPYCGMSRSNY